MMFKFYMKAAEGAKTNDTLVSIVVYASKCKAIDIREYNELCRAVYSKVV